MAKQGGLSRRGVLRTIGAGAATATVGGTGTAIGGSGGGELVRVNAGVADGAGENAVRRVAESVHRAYGFDALTVAVPRSAVADLRARGDVRYVERDGRVAVSSVGSTAATVPGTQLLPYGIDRVDADALDATGEGVDVAVVDTGIDASHPDLLGRVGNSWTVVGSWATGQGLPGGQDDNGHGTHVAGTIGAADGTAGVVGVAPEVTLHAVKALTAAGVGYNADIARGIEVAADAGWDVVNLSVETTNATGARLLRDACRYARERGVVLVAAAGNGGPCADCVRYPGALETTVGVGATTESDRLAGFSSTGEGVDLAAPGKSVLSTHPGGTYARMSGTSMAAPHVAGAAALLRAAGYGPGETEDRLTGTAEGVGLSANAGGAGLLDAGRAVAGRAGNGDTGTTPGPVEVD